MADLENIIMRRIRAANFGRKATIELLYVKLDDDAHGAIAYSYSSAKRSCVAQIHIPKTMGRALVTGKKNTSLDALLRY